MPKQTQTFALSVIMALLLLVALVPVLKAAPEDKATNASMDTMSGSGEAKSANASNDLKKDEPTKAVEANTATADTKKDEAVKAAVAESKPSDTGKKPEEAKKDQPLTPVEEGKKLVFDQRKGNCLTCHLIVGGELTGNIGPPLVAMKDRYPSLEKLRAQIYDPRVANPNTVMIPFGPMGILTDEEINKVAAYIHTL